MARTLAPDKVPPKLTYSRLEAAAALGISPRCLDNWSQLEDGPKYVKYDRRKLYPVAALHEWLERHSQ